MINKQLFELSRVKFELGLFWVFEHDQKYSQVIYHCFIARHLYDLYSTFL